MPIIKRTQLEPGFLQAFRLFVVTRIVFWIVIGPILIVMQMARAESLNTDQVISMSLIERLTLPNISPVLVMEVTLLVLLVLPQVPRLLGRWFVPLTLMWGLVPILIGFYWWPSKNPLQNPFAIFFFVMLVLIAWQYSFRYILAYVLGLTLYQLWLVPPLTDRPVSVDVSWLILQAAMMLLVGYIIVQLVSIQREQRTALARAYEQQAAANARLQRYAATLEELTISRERNRLARELHDTLAHSLSAITIQLEAIRSLWQLDPGAAREILDKADETARRGLTEARRALRALRASPLQDVGLAPALRELAKSAAERTGATLEMHIPEQLGGDLPLAVEQGVYRIAQETLENVVRHAEPHLIVVRLGRNAGRLTFTVEDDGRGIDLVTGQASEDDKQDQLGIRGIKERANMIGGHLQITSRAGEGTKVDLVVPLSAHQMAEPPQEAAEVSS
jgi:signal transduction histidine kinase